jgi:2-oxo-4-hydroxy-4-carboxy-5-ureidoimidazoline decarboxylase
MSEALARWNRLTEDEAAAEILPCCGSRAWAGKMAALRPLPDEAALLAAAGEAWLSLPEADWVEAFESHPRIGASSAPLAARAQSAAWSAHEQGNVADAEDAVKLALAEANREYERLFGRIFIVCATGKSAAEMLAILRRRLQNDKTTELREAAEQQRQITQLRLRKWLAAKSQPQAATS